MLSKSTIFVLGAGASVPYNYPCGSKLCRNICNNLRGEYADQFQQLLKCEFSKDNIIDFRDALSHNIGLSIDIFLQNNRKRFLEIGKYAIAQELIKYEDTSALFEYNEKNWYRHLCDYLIKGCNGHNEFQRNNIGFVTFNYDRSLEHFLYRGLKKLYEDAQDEDIARIINAIPIIHIHGILDYLPWQKYSKNGGRDYGHTIDNRILVKTIEELNIACEGVRAEFDRNAISELFDDAELIYFIGFEYDKNNLHKLGISSAKKRGLHPIYGSTYGMGGAKRTETEKYFKEVLASPIQLGDAKKDAIEFLKDYF